MRAWFAILAATLTRVRRTVAVRARPSVLEAILAAARVRLNAIAARTSQALFAVNFPYGACASGPSLRSANTASMMAWSRWQASASTMPRVLVVKTAW